MPIRPYFMATESGQHICHPIIPAHIRNLMSRRVTRNSNENLQKKHSRDTGLFVGWGGGGMTLWIHNAIMDP